MLWQSAPDVDFSNIDYDFVLTPYVNLEIYEHMELGIVMKSSHKIYLYHCGKSVWITPTAVLCFNIISKDV